MARSHKTTPTSMQMLPRLKERLIREELAPASVRNLTDVNTTNEIIYWANHFILISYKFTYTWKLHLLDQISH